MYFILYCLIFALPAWAIPIVATCNSVHRGIVAYTQRRRGIYYPLPTYKQELQRIDAKWASFCESLPGLLTLTLFYGILILGPVLYVDNYASP